MRQILPIVAAMPLAPLAALHAADAPAAKPNILIVLTDDQGYGDFSFSGNPRLKTPHLDRLHERSIRLTDFHVAPMCTPTRSQLMTGVDAARNGAFMACSGYSSIRPGIPTLPEILRANGYRTGLFGKWHLGDNAPHRPMDRGFDHAVWHKGWGISSVPDRWNNDYFDDTYWVNDETKAFRGYCTDIWFDEAMAWMGACGRDRAPFFAYLSLNAPHGPLFVADNYRQPYADLPRPLATFFGMIANIDENMGRLEDMLERSGLDDNTILIFMTDNGGTVGVRFYNAGMRGGKMSLYDGGHRVPCLIRWPAGNLAPPGDRGGLTLVQDIAPTLFDFCGIGARPDVDGISLAALLRGRALPALESRIAVVQYGNQPWHSLELPVRHDACVMWRSWRLVKGEELYDIASDPSQKRDVAADHPPIVDRMRAHYETWWSQVEPRVYGPAIPIGIGCGRERETLLTSHDWMTLNTANQSNVREGANRSGAWAVEAARAGTYTFRLYRWPKESGLAMREAAPEYLGVDGVFPAGAALPIRRANLRIDAQEYTAEVREGDVFAEFAVPLPAAPVVVQTALYDDRRNRLCGAYYVSVEGPRPTGGHD